MRIAYIGNHVPSHSTETHVALSAEAEGHEVVRLQENRVDWSTLPDVVLAHGCGMLMWTRTWACDNEAAVLALKRLDAAGVPTVAYHLDRWWGLDREPQITSEAFFRCSLVVTADGGHDDEWARAGVNHRWLPPAVYDAECRPVTARRNLYPGEIVFVGSHPYPHRQWEPYRTALIERLRGRYGRRFQLWPRSGVALRGRDLARLYATAKIVVGDSCLAPRRNGTPMANYMSDRIPETIGRGGFLIHPHVAGVTDGACYEPGVHLAVYPLGDLDALCRTVDHFLRHADERQRIAAQGRAHVLAHHTYRHRVATLAEWAASL